MSDSKKFQLCFRYSGTTHLRLAKESLDEMTEYRGRHNTAATRGLAMATFRLDQELTTPYGNLAGSAVRPGHRASEQAAGV